MQLLSNPALREDKIMPKNWSFSSLMNYERCPMSVSFPYRSNDEKTPNEAAQRGIDLHAACEQYLLRHTTTNPFPDAVNMDFAALAGKPNLPEQQWGFNKLWQPVEFKEGWLKVVADVVLPPNEPTGRVTIIDFKTGKREYNEVKHTMQTQLYLTAASKVYPDAQEFVSELWYLDHDKVIISPIYGRDKLAALCLRWNTRADRMTSATDFPAKPSKSNCRFCEQRDRCGFAYED